MQVIHLLGHLLQKSGMAPGNGSRSDIHFIYHLNLNHLYPILMEIHLGEHQYGKKRASELTIQAQSTLKSRRWQLSHWNSNWNFTTNQIAKHRKQLHTPRLLASLLADPCVLNVSFSLPYANLPTSRRMLPSLAVRLSSAQQSIDPITHKTAIKS